MLKYGLMIVYCTSLFPVTTLEFNYKKQFDQALAKAVIKNKDEEITPIIKQGANLQVKNISERTLLHLAIARKADKSVLVLLAEGIDLKPRDHSGSTAVTLARKKGPYKLQIALKEFMDYYSEQINHESVTTELQVLEKQSLQEMWFKRLCLLSEITSSELFWIWSQLATENAVKLLAKSDFRGYSDDILSLLQKRSIPSTLNMLDQKKQLLSALNNHDCDDLIFVWD